VSPRLTKLLLPPLAALALLLAGCASPDERDRQRGTEVIERAREAHGSTILDHARVTFTFRGDRYSVQRDGGAFAYTRCFDDDAGAEVCDTLDNDGIRRQRGTEPVPLAESEERAVETTVNSVVYFALLPYNLADPAVRPRWREEQTVRGEPYDVVEVTFEQDGGGRDWEDRFVYWVHRQRGTMDYLAYDFHTGDGGTRFREAFDARTVGGVLVADYRNYAPDPDAPLASLESLAALLEEGQLELVSEVILEDVRVEPLLTR
jgi:hypothetical protein